MDATLGGAEVLNIDLPHLKMTALAWGPDDGRLALCLHGYPDSAHSWRYVAPMLAASGYRVIAPFTRGYFPTPVPDDRDYHIGALMYDALAVHRYLGEPADAVLIGHDYGAWTANALAACPKSPFAVHIAMAMPPIPAVSKSDLSPLRQAGLFVRQLRWSWYVVFQQLPWLPETVLPRVINRLWVDWSPKTADVRADVAITLEAIPTRAHRSAVINYYRANFRPPKPSSDYVDLHRHYLEVPVHPIMLMYGNEDGAVQQAYFTAAASVLPPGSRLEMIPGGGHFLQVDQPGAVFDAIIGYLGPARGRATA